MNVRHKLQLYAQEGKVPEKFVKILEQFFLSYAAALPPHRISSEQVNAILERYLDLVVKQLQHPFSFEPYHQKVTSPIDYRAFGLDLMRPLIAFEGSHVFGLDQVEKMEQQLKNGENVVLFGNHQIEPDPQIISLLLEKSHSDFASNLIFVAGDRVVTGSSGCSG